MAKSKGLGLTERESQIMEVLWTSGPSTADAIRAALPGDPHDSTVRTLLRVMEQKGLVAHRLDKRTYVYSAKVAQNKAQQKAVRGLLKRLFGGSVKNLVLQLLDDEEITPEELERLAHESKTVSKSPQKRGES